MDLHPSERRPRPRAFLEDWCRRQDGGPYAAYRDLRGRFSLHGLDLEILRVQPDPFAGPSRLRLLIPYASTALDPEIGQLSGGRGTKRPGVIDPSSARALGTRDYLGRCLERYLGSGGGLMSGRPGLAIDRHGQEVLDRSAVLLRPEHLEVRFECHLPARGRRILGREAEALLLHLPERLIQACLGKEALDLSAARRHADCVEDFAFLQEELERRGWIAFVADGSRLARRGGADDRPLVEGEVVPFQAPAEMRHAVRLPHGGEVSGMALTPGVTLLCGGGFHGKSTLLRALAAAVFPHVPGDGRERVATRPDAQCARAEDGRAVTGADLSPFLHDLPFGRPSADFTTDNASGSTSQAAGILEAIQGGSRLLLIDEDTSATNFMIRDPAMERLLTAHQEPITPYLHRARLISDGMSVSSVLVIGGSGEYFRVADRVLLFDTYRPYERTAEARAIVSDRLLGGMREEDLEIFRRATSAERRLPLGPERDGKSRGPGRGGEREGERGGEHGNSPRIKALEARRLLVGGMPLELTGMEALRSLSQARFLARFLSWRFREQPGPGHGMTGVGETVAELTEAVQREWTSAGLDAFDHELRGDLAAARILDLLAAVHRLRSSAAPGSDRAGEEPGGAE